MGIVLMKTLIAIEMLVIAVASAAHAAKSDLAQPEIVKVERTATSLEAKTVVVGNAIGRYTLTCNPKAGGCLTPSPGQDYYLFKKQTRWKMPGATQIIDLKFVQDWTVTY